jgi:hypothetical protein
MTAMDTRHVIEAGDFIRGKGTGVTGFVTGTKTVGGRLKIFGYTIRDCHGREDFIDHESAILCAKSEAWEERLAAEAAKGQEV